ncbi:hypothetical protein [Methylobacterium sp. WL9]|uniref:hypothetical protein n=1 Tax=Methylobacterium sp. WL9 TaxID=2603898 RepID=UPI0011C91CE3|nr:hypothetical protein [Methylobacterium sp. WL9]TXN22918.1 hypothetical protein FV217_08830 [Methylobacterium sp. WL9]
MDQEARSLQRFRRRWLAVTIDMEGAPGAIKPRRGSATGDPNGPIPTKPADDDGPIPEAPSSFG